MTNTVTDEGAGHKYYAQLPNIVFDLGLRPFPLALYGQLKRIVGANGGPCDDTTRQLADRLGCSPMAISKALAELAIARPELGGKALIRVAKVADGKGARKPRNIIALVDVWPENMARYGGTTVNTVDGTVNNMYGAVNTVDGGRKHSVHPKELEKNEEQDSGVSVANDATGEDAPPIHTPPTDAWAPVKDAISAMFGGLPTAAKDGRPKACVGQTLSVLGRAAGDDPDRALVILARFAGSKDREFCNRMSSLPEAVGSWLGKHPDIVAITAELPTVAPNLNGYAKYAYTVPSTGRLAMKGVYALIAEGLAPDTAEPLDRSTWTAEMIAAANAIEGISQ